MIEMVAPRLVDRIRIVTVHDAIYCRVGDLGLVEEAFREIFEEIGFEMKLKTERCSAARHLSEKLVVQAGK